MKKPIVTISLPKEVKAAQEEEAKRQEISASALFEKDLNEEIEKEGK